MSENVLAYIEKNWDLCIKNNRRDEGTLIGLPYPYTVPAVGHFDELYYWDTYFTNKGLELSGRYQQAKNNVDNMLYLVDKYGYMPNGNRKYYIGRSQPPFLSMMVRDVYEYYKDPVWLGSAYETLKKEYAFWTTERNSEIKLSHYDQVISEPDYESLAARLVKRVGFRPELSDGQLARHFYSVAESGWDVTPRWGFECYEFAAVDLNSLLFALEMNMSYFARELNNGQENEWKQLANERRDRMIACMENEDGLLLDYNFVTKKRSSIFSAASFYPLFAGVAESRHAEALVKNLDRLEAPYGVLTCEKNDTKGKYQWDYPNGWACIQYIAISGLMRYGYREEANRLAEKYVSLVEKVFEETGNLWEKYNVVEGNINVTNEYKLPAMMGWSAGVYLAALRMK